MPRKPKAPAPGPEKPKRGGRGPWTPLQKAEAKIGRLTRQLEQREARLAEFIAQHRQRVVDNAELTEAVQAHAADYEAREKLISRLKDQIVHTRQAKDLIIARLSGDIESEREKTARLEAKLKKQTEAYIYDSTALECRTAQLANAEKSVQALGQRCLTLEAELTQTRAQLRHPFQRLCRLTEAALARFDWRPFA